MATLALAPYAGDGPRLRFVANVDGADLATALAGLSSATTLFVVISKTFTTMETLTNARTARDWFRAQAGAEADLARHFVAVSNNVAACAEFGIDPARSFEIWDWVGGRYSLWSAVGLPVMLAIGFEHFAELLEGAHAMDEHFRSAPLDRNMPVLLALLGLWYIDFFGAETHAVLPYDHGLRRLPAYLQQLEMESNGKRVTRDGEAIDYATGPVLWGEPGTNSQHSFLQELHQGTRVIPADFLLPAVSAYPSGPHHELLIANCLAQSEALMRGKTIAEARAELKAEGRSTREIEFLAPHKVFPGNRPSNTILYRRLDPTTLGMLIALYEHKIFVQGVIWGINSFDQWGVELGKSLANELLPIVEGKASASERDSSTAGLIEAIGYFRRF
jgi:glucose-6-phosphate isomerase